MDSILQDVRYRSRMIRRRPIVSGVALGSLAIGIALSTVVFSLLNAVVLRPLPVAEPDDLAIVLEIRSSGVNHNAPYGSMSYAVSQRTREIGVRVALGASAAEIRTLVLSQGLGLAVLGTIFGVGLALLLARAIETRLYGVTSADLPTLALSATTLSAIAMVASYVPARRASRIDPVDALREN